MAKKSSHDFVPATDIFDNPPDLLSISPIFDAYLKGIPLGSWVILSGQPKAGKSSLGVHIIKKFLQEYSAPSKALIVDVENRLKKVQLSQVGLDKSRIEVLRSSKKKILHAEDYLGITEEWVKDNPKSVILIDSTSALCSTKEYTDEVTAQTRSLGPKLLANFCRKMAPIIPVQESIMILITHVIANTSGYGAPYMSDSGKKIQFQSDISLLCKNAKPWEDKGKTIGQENDWKVVWSATGTPPGASFKSYLRYHHGIDEIKELLTLALDIGLIDQAGAWYTMTFMDYASDLCKETLVEVTGKPYDKAIKFQGIDNLYAFLAEHHYFFEELNLQATELL